MAPGSLLWLLTHEVRLTLRMFSSKRRWGLWAGLGVLILLALVAGVPIALALKASAPIAPTPAFNAIAFAAGFFTFTLLLSQILSLTVMAFFERGDFDLLLSSPIRPDRVLIVRCVSVAMAPLLLYVLLISPFLLPAIVLADARLLAVYGVLAGLTLMGAAGGMALALGLFCLFGPRKTRTIGQVLAALIGAIVFLLAQVSNYLPQHGGTMAGRLKSLVDSGAFAPEQPLGWLGTAALGAPGPLLGLLAVSAVVFFFSAKVLGPTFAKVTAQAAGAAIATTSRGKASVWFSGSLKTALIRKELTLIARDPALISQVLLRCLYFIPMVLAVAKATMAAGPDIAVVGICGWVVLFASQIAGSLAWIAVSAEDAPDLLKTAPVSALAVRNAKIASALWPVGVLSALPVGFLLTTHPWMGVVTAAGVYLACLSVCYVNLWYEKPQNRATFRRRGQGSIVANLGEVFLGLAFLPVTALAAMGSFWALPLALLPIIILGGLYLGRRHEA